MANTPRSGADGTAWAIGYQSAYGTHINQNEKSGTPPVGMEPYLFPASEISLDEDAEITESDLISAFGADTPTEIGQLWGAGSITTGILPEHFIHIIRGILNPSLINGAALTVNAGDQPLANQPNALPPSRITIDAAKRVPKAKHGSVDAYEFPSKIQLALTGSPTVASDAKMVITGRRRIGRDTTDLISDVQTVDITADTGAISDTFWGYVETVDVTGVTGGTNPSHQLNWVPDTYYLEAVFRPSDVRFPGWTMLLLKGGVPYLVYDAVPINVNITADGTGISVSMDILASRVEELRTVAGGLFTEKVKLDDVPGPTPARDPNADVQYFEDVSLARMPGFAGALSFGDDIVKYNSIEIGVNRNLDFNAGTDGSRFRSGVSPTANRQVTFVPNTQFISGEVATDTFKRWQKIFRLAQRQPLAFQMLSYDQNSRQKQIKISTPSAQITESPNVSATGPGPIERRIPFKGLLASGVSSEVKFEIWSETQYTV